MAISDFVKKMTRFCEASSQPDLRGLSYDFHGAGHGQNNMNAGADRVLEQSVEVATPSVFRPR